MKRWVPIFLLLSLLLTGCGGNTKDYEAEILRLREENNSLQAQVESLQAQLNQLKNTRLESWTLEARGAGEGEPASIVFTARPSAHEEGQKAELVVSREGQEEARIPADWDGELFRASLTLPPQDGYGYYCVLTSAEGTMDQTALTTPENPVLPKLTYLASSLKSYASALALDPKIDKDRITLDVTAAVQAPLLTQDGTPSTVEEAKLLWLLGDETLSEIPVELDEGETEGSFVGSVQDVTLSLPDLDDGGTLRLLLSVRLSDGRTLTAEAASWTETDGELEDAVG